MVNIPDELRILNGERPANADLSLIMSSYIYSAQLIT